MLLRADEHDNLGHAGRFGAGLPRIIDGSLLFLQHMISKMKPLPRNPEESGERSFNRFWEKMSRSLGNKRKQVAGNGEEKGIGFITRLYGDFAETEFVKIFPNEFFGYWRAVVERPQKDENGAIVTGRDGAPKADAGLRDYENIPFLRKDPDDAGDKLIPQSIDEYFQREVKPHLPDAWIDGSKTKTGYEINFAKYFYKFKSLRSLTEIKADILALEESSLELEKKVLL